jgi:predicted transcriptional regulator
VHDPHRGMIRPSTIPPLPPEIATLRRGGGGRSIDIFVGHRLRTRRIELGISQGDLATVIRMPTIWIAAYERGDERIVAAHLIQFAHLLDIEISFFFEGA